MKDDNILVNIVTVGLKDRAVSSSTTKKVRGGGEGEANYLSLIARESTRARLAVSVIVAALRKCMT